MQKGRIALLILIAVIFFSSFGFMNYNYDPLSRYPYQDKESRELIKRYLNDKEIEYIIEYSIAPSVFINFIKEDKFNVYHAKDYYDLSVLQWRESPKNIVKMVEGSKNFMDIETLSNHLAHYSYDELSYWFKNQDPYNPNSKLVSNAGDMSAYLDDNYCVTNRVPFNLQELNSEVPTLNKEPILVDVAIQKPLKNLGMALKEEKKTKKPCGGLLVESGYISYQQQKSLYEAASSVYKEEASLYEFYPGHSEHQLGLAIDFTIDDIDKDDFARTPQSFWLENNAHKFGFIQTYSYTKSNLYNKKAQPYHYRFVGYELANYIYDNNSSLKETLNK